MGGQECNTGTPQDAITNYPALLDLYHGMWPNARFVVFQIVNGLGAVYSSTIVWNNALPGLWDAAAARGIKLVRATADLILDRPGDFEADDAHPNEAAGNVKIAANARQAFRNVLGYQ